MNSAYIRQVCGLSVAAGYGIVRAISEDRHTGENLVVLHDVGDVVGDDVWRTAMVKPGIGAEFYEVKEYPTEQQAFSAYGNEHIGPDPIGGSSE